MVYAHLTAKHATAENLTAALCARLEPIDALDVSQELMLLRGYLEMPQAPAKSPEQRRVILDKFYIRSFILQRILLTQLAEAPLPLIGKLRQAQRNAQELLKLLADSLLDLEDSFGKSTNDTRNAGKDLLLWRALHLISRHLLISSLTASPPGAGIWRQLHQVFRTVQELGITESVPEGEELSLSGIYFAAILLGCAQPASFSGNEISFLATYLEQYSRQMDWHEDPPEERASFWIDPQHDTPATSMQRRLPPPDSRVRHFSCRRLSTLLERQIAQLEAGIPPESIQLPPYAASPAGKSVLRRLMSYWRDPPQRRFPRRKQNYRGRLCTGLDNISRLLQGESGLAATSSDWMITNESPDGYSVMHIAGKTGTVAVGDIAALLTETGNDWQLCIVRWVLSGNPEHLEIGLQILSAHALAALLCVPRCTPGKSKCVAAIMLPATPPLRLEETLIIPSGTLSAEDDSLVLVIEKDNIEVREISTVQHAEQNSRIEIIAITPTDRTATGDFSESPA